MEKAGSLGTVLLVDDETDVIDYFNERFKDYPAIRLITAQRGDEGIATALREKPKVIVMDLRMPKLGGEEALRKLKPLLPGTRFLVITGCGDEVMRERVLQEITVDAFFDKPLDFDKVMTSVLSFLRS